MSNNNYKRLQDMGQNNSFINFKSSNYSPSYTSNVRENFISTHNKNKPNNNVIVNNTQENFIPPHNINNTIRNFTSPHNDNVRVNNTQENFIPTRNRNKVIDNFTTPHNENKSHNIEMNIQTATGIASSPDIFGPSYWYILHSGSISYPINPTPIVKEKMKNFIIGIPIMIPCKNCQEHATSYIEKYYNNLDIICSSRDSLFKFFVDFHNAVNNRLNKPLVTYDDAYKMYSGKVKINKMNYT